MAVGCQRGEDARERWRTIPIARSDANVGSDAGSVSIRNTRFSICRIRFGFFHSSVFDNVWFSALASRRQLKAAEAIREVVASSILTEIRDPRVSDVTVIGVSVSPDMREAKVSVSVMGGEKVEKLSLAGLRSSAGFLQKQIANRIDTRHTPRLTFEIDRGMQNSMAVGEILAKIRREKAAEHGENLAGTDDDGASEAIGASISLEATHEGSPGALFDPNPPAEDAADAVPPDDESSRASPGD